METDRSSFCGCKGIRTCIKCEKEYSILKPEFDFSQYEASYVYCCFCNKAWEGSDDAEHEKHPNHSGKSIEFPGVFIQLDFISQKECDELMNDLDLLPWDTSQSGRRKQNFGPKCNFKKRKLRAGNFSGFPAATRFIQDRFSKVDLLENFQTIEQCSLEYDSARGSSIDAHIDDCWIWGERIVTVNLIGDSVLSMVPYRGTNTKYNLIDAPHPFNEVPLLDPPNIVVRIPMPSRSLLVLYGEARYWWLHLIPRHDISGRRVCLAYREFTEPYLEGGKFEGEGDSIRERIKF
ncbi:alpha-ketoglutarate-dependent dioxygenase alkB homolog 4 [Nilaparvata lugens]|uniref:alpha-ketoglutarate-dependent dioxygenase alkB homolog 4 n=1 Tax=Nilaparvata lugens TaxID=108931 RepID=UPI00193E0278|nr:alpha-ketoglutarate-dependent dioxygenase alkB homolog 4 [Nilaparvata lugens]